MNSNNQNMFRNTKYINPYCITNFTEYEYYLEMEQSDYDGQIHHRIKTV